MQLQRSIPTPSPLARSARHTPFLAPLTLLALAVSSATAQTPSFTLLGIPHGSTGSGGSAISADGLTAAGGTTNAYGFVWTRSQGRTDFGTGIVGSTFAYGISGNGLVAVGGDEMAGPAFRWTATGGYQSLGTAGFSAAAALDASFDGSVIAGVVASPGVQRAFRWTQAEGMQPIPNTTASSSRALAVSGDGLSIVGSTYAPDRAFVWTAVGGTQFLPNIGGSGWAEARAVNFDGTIIVGNSGEFGNFPTMWVNGVPQEMVRTIPNSQFFASGLSDDGSIVTGLFQLEGGVFEPGVWTAATGAVLFEDFVAGHGVPIPNGVSLVSCTGVSSDGRSFVGTATGPGFFGQAYVLSIPSPGAVATLGIAALVAIRRRRSV